MSDERARLPGFDANGNLPPGVYRVSLDDIGARFAWNATRRRLFRGLRRAVAILAAAGVRRAYLGGSYVSSEAAPCDVDVLWELEASVDLAALDEAFRGVASWRAEVKRRYGIDFLVGVAPELTEALLYLLQSDRSGCPRGILLIELEGEP